MDPVMFGMAAGAATSVANNFMSQYNSSTSYERERALMDKQNSMNMANMVGAPGAQVRGLRQAGFNPAMVAGAGTQAAPQVSKGSADMAHTEPFNAQDALAMAQIANLNAQTEKTKAETVTENQRPENVKADTGLKTAEMLYVSGAKTENTKADTKRIDAEAQRINNVNTVFSDENKYMADAGRGMAEKWQASPWYNELGQETKDTIDAIASGELPLTIGGLEALKGVIDLQKNLSDADRSVVKNAFDNAITEGMFNDKDVKAALIKMPEEQLKNLKAKTAEAIAHRGLLNIQTKQGKLDFDWSTEKHGVYQKQDKDYLYAEYQKDPSLENLGKWLSATVNDKLNTLYENGTKGIGPAAGGYLAGKGMKNTQTNTQTTRTTTYPEAKTPPLYDPQGNRIKGTGFTKSYTIHENVNDRGVGDFRYE